MFIVLVYSVLSWFRKIVYKYLYIYCSYTFGHSSFIRLVYSFIKNISVMKKENFDLLFSLLAEKMLEVEKDTFESNDKDKEAYFEKYRRNYLDKLLSTHEDLIQL